VSRPPAGARSARREGWPFPCIADGSRKEKPHVPRRPATKWNNSVNVFPGEGGGIYNAGTPAALTVLDSSFSNNSPDNISGPYTDGGGNTFH
jgi:hypothetical protein